MKGRTLWQETESAFGETMALAEKIDRLSHELTKLDPRSSPYGDLLEEIGELELLLDSTDPARMKPKIESVLKGLGFQTKDFTRDCSEFSGGWQMRIAMAKLFLQEPEVLLLDEPTNHLDIGTQIWVEQYLVNYPGAILLISHDRALFDTLCTRTIAFSNGRAEEYAGNFSYFERESVLRKEIQLKQYEAQQREIGEIQRFIDRFRASANKATLVQSRIKMLAKIERIPQPERDDAVMNFKFPPPPNSGHMVAKLDGVSKSYGPLNIFSGFDFEINKGEKFAIVGPNGAGKSTFCRLITGQEEPDAGTHTFGHKVATSFFSQNHADELDPENTVLETVEAAASREAAPHARNLLGCFLFRGDDVFKKVGVLSGGERSRVALVCMLLRPANFLILDEPTNHLDMQSQDVLQRALIDYPGSVMIVSHNRNFLDALVTKTLEFQPGRQPILYAGNITYYLEKSAEDEATKKGMPKLATLAPAEAGSFLPPAHARREPQGTTPHRSRAARDQLQGAQAAGSRIRRARNQDRRTRRRAGHAHRAAFQRGSGQRSRQTPRSHQRRGQTRQSARSQLLPLGRALRRNRKDEGQAGAGKLRGRNAPRRRQRAVRLQRPIQSRSATRPVSQPKEIWLLVNFGGNSCGNRRVWQADAHGKHGFLS